MPDAEPKHTSPGPLWWRAWVMGLVAGTFWSGWLYALLAAPGFPGTTTTLNFYSLSNSRMEAEGRNESHLLALQSLRIVIK